MSQNRDEAIAALHKQVQDLTEGNNTLTAQLNKLEESHPRIYKSVTEPEPEEKKEPETLADKEAEDV